MDNRPASEAILVLNPCDIMNYVEGGEERDEDELKNQCLQSAMLARTDAAQRRRRFKIKRHNAMNKKTTASKQTSLISSEGGEEQKENSSLWGSSADTAPILAPGNENALLFGYSERSERPNTELPSPKPKKGVKLTGLFRKKQRKSDLTAMKEAQKLTPSIQGQDENHPFYN